MKVLIVGGGIVGFGIAMRLAQGGAEVTVFERSMPGTEASFAAGGILGAQAEADRPGPFLDLCVESRARFPAFAREVEELAGVDVGYLPSGVLEVASSERAHEALATRVRWQTQSGLAAELLSGAEARAMEPELSPELLGAAYFPDDHQVDNRKLMRGLMLACGALGVTVQLGHVQTVHLEHGRATGVDVDGALQRGDAVVLAAGAWSGLIQGWGLSGPHIRPARGQMLMFQTQRPLLRKIIYTERGYLIPRADGRIIAGSTLEFTGFQKVVTAAGIARIVGQALLACPALEHAELIESWSGLRPYSDDRLPFLGAGPSGGLFLATGHFRNGILLAPVTADLIADAVLGRRPTLSLAPFRYDRATSSREG